MAYEIKNNEIAWAPAVENINRGFRVFGVSSDDSMKVLTYQDMTLHVPNGGNIWINDIRRTWLTSLQDNFENGITEWESGDDTTTSEENSIVQSGTKSLKLSWNHDGSTQFANRVQKLYNVIDFKYRNKLIFHFYPVANLEDKLYIKYKNNDNEFILAEVLPQDVTAGQWNKIEIDLPPTDVQKNKFQALIFEFDGLQWSTGTHEFYIDEVSFDTLIDIVEADPNDERKDIITMGEDGKIELITGTPQSQNPVEPPDLPADRCCLAIITVPAGSTQITAGQIFDTRVPNTFAVNADKTKNELTTIKNEIVQLALTDIEQNALLNLPSEIPFSNMVVEKFWDRDGLNNTVETVNEGENMHGYYEALDAPRGQINVSGLPDISGMGGTGWAEATWRTRAYYWRGKVWTWMHSTSVYNEIGWGIASINPVTGEKIFANIWTDDWQLDPNDTNPNGSREFSYYKQNSTQWCAHPKDWTHDEDYLYVPVYVSSIRIGYYSSQVIILAIDEDGNVVRTIQAEETNGPYHDWYAVHQFQYDVNLKSFLIYHSGRRYTDWGHHNVPVMYDKNWNSVFVGNMQDTNYYPYLWAYIPDNQYLYQLSWYNVSGNYRIYAYRWRIVKKTNGDLDITYQGGYTQGNHTNTFGRPFWYNQTVICNQKDRIWMCYRDAEYHLRCLYIEAGTNDDWWENYNLGDNPLDRGLVMESSVESTQTNGLPYVSYAVAYGSDTAFYGYGDKTYKLEGGKGIPGEVVAAGSFAGRRGVSAVGKTSLAFWDTTNDAFYIADYSNALTGREQTGFDMTTKTFNFENVKGLYITAKVAGRGTSDLLSMIKVDVLDNLGTPITGLTNLSVDTYHVIPVELQPIDQFKLRFHFTPDGTKNILAQFHEYGVFVDNEVV
ncbi:hypothetical protein K9M74_03310 [Candidatus Woesearchaeota archaeon]|nr:hypothetical protein [Candidatus Woesearchaeota archaeon]MCF7859170.1 hypothetical protein [Candidatus Cloacimonadota bacterium]MCF8012809.1 hypothetical protein [Candidatus Woesearchaeota archaeon]